MKSLVLFLFVLAGAWAQPVKPPVPVAPPVPPTAQETGDTVIAVFDDGTKMTADQFRALLPALQGQYLQIAQQDRKQFLHIYAMMRAASRMATAEQLDQKSPNKEALAYSRMETLTNIKLKNVLETATATPEEVDKYYNDHKDMYKQVKVGAIYIAFADAAEVSAAPAASSVAASRMVKKALTEEEAKAKATKLVADIRAGADFKKLVEMNSDDETSRGKGGDFGAWKVTDNVPDVMRPVVFGLKPGEIGDPVRQAHGFYIFRADEVNFTPLAQVRDGIFEQIKKQHATEWMQKLDKDTKVEFPAPAAPGLAK